MSKNLEELIEFRKDNNLNARQKIIYHIVRVLEDFEKRISKLEKYTQEEIEDIKLGGTD